MSWDRDYRLLREGEIILPSDDFMDEETTPITWRQPSTGVIGMHAPDPLYTSHRKYRRRLQEKNE